MPIIEVPMYIYPWTSISGLKIWWWWFFDMVSKANVTRDHKLKCHLPLILVKYLAPCMMIECFASTRLT